MTLLMQSYANRTRVPETEGTRRGAVASCELGETYEARRKPLVGIEPTTARLRIECSTTELQWRKVRDALARIRTATPFGTTPSR